MAKGTGADLGLRSREVSEDSCSEDMSETAEVIHGKGKEGVWSTRREGVTCTHAPEEGCYKLLERMWGVKARR